LPSGSFGTSQWGALLRTCLGSLLAESQSDRIAQRMSDVHQGVYLSRLRP
jgi:hypothetical protein